MASAPQETGNLHQKPPSAMSDQVCRPPSFPESDTSRTSSERLQLSQTVPKKLGEGSSPRTPRHFSDWFYHTSSLRSSSPERDRPRCLLLTSPCSPSLSCSLLIFPSNLRAGNGWDIHLPPSVLWQSNKPSNQAISSLVEKARPFPLCVLRGN